MEIKELSKIKEYQREFKQLFNKSLEINWELMKPLEKEVSLNSILEKCFKKRNAKINVIYEKKIGRYSSNEKLALCDFCTIVINNKLNINVAAELIKRDRSLIYYYAGKR